MLTYTRPLLWDFIEKGNPYNPFPWQARHFHAQRNVPRLIAACGRRSGKSSGMKAVIVDEVSQEPTIVHGVAQAPLVYVAGPTAETSMKVWQPVWDLFVPPDSGSFAPPLGFMHETHDKQRRWIKLKNGAQLFGKTADDPRSLQGDRVTLAVVDEAHEITEEAWENLMPGLSDSQGRLIAIGIPRGRGRFRSYWELGQGADGNFYSFSVPTSANPIYAQMAAAAGYEDVDKYIREQFAADLTDDEFNRQYMAKWTEEDGTVFRGLDDVFIGNWGRRKDGMNLAMGLDIGKLHDYTVAYIGDLNTGRFIYRDRFNGLDYTSAVPRIAELAKRFHVQYIHMDVTGVGEPVADMLRREGVNIMPFIFTNNSKSALINTFVREVERRQVFLPRHDKELRREMEMFDGTVSGSVIKYSAPKGYYDDCVIAAALLVDRMAKRHQYKNFSVKSYAKFSYGRA